VADGGAERAFGVYVHVPFCSRRCGYCDFVTYTTADLGGDRERAGYVAAVGAELDLAVRVLEGSGVARRAVSTVFFGGGTPTVLPAQDLARLLGAVRDRFGLATGAEVTVEANPDSVTRGSLAELAGAGFTRVSFGMQSAVPHVLAALERTHDPDNVPAAVGWARGAGLAVSLDVIYGTPQESEDDWLATLAAVLECAPDHVSAYPLVVEPGTRLGSLVAAGRATAPDDDDLAARYELTDAVLAGAGYTWYEVSNWARTPADACRHNLGYWRGDDWWGAGPGAHSHVGGVRWWNVRSPRRHADLVGSGLSPAEGRETLTAQQLSLEQVLLGTRLSDGLPLEQVPASGRTAVAALIADGLIEGHAALAGRVVLTLRGRLLADTVVRALTP
jgi:putative oxygen-independent coproporphyrinogen III oxidase